MTYVRFIVYILSKFPGCEEYRQKNVTESHIFYVYTHILEKAVFGRLFCYMSSLCIPECMLRKARDRKFVCLRKSQPAPDFRGPAASIPPLCFRALF